MNKYASRWTQIWTLTKKCLLLLKRSWWWTFFRSFLLPVAYIIFMGQSKHFYYPYAVYGVGNAKDIKPLSEQVGSSLLAFYSLDEKVTDEMKRVTNIAFKGVPEDQIHQLTTMNDVVELCKENFQGVGPCFGAIQWNSIDLEQKIYNYTVRANSGLSDIDVKGESATDTTVMPLQWAVDKAITNLTDTPQSMTYTSETQEQYDQKLNQQFTDIIADWIAPALFLGMIGAIYHLTGVVALERELGLSNLLSAMNVGRVSRLISYFLSFSLVYLIGWVVIGIVLAVEVYTESNVAIFIFYHIFSGMSMISFSLFIGSLFKSAQLAGILSSGVAVILAIAVTLQTKIGDPMDSAAVYVLSVLFPPSCYSYFLATSARWQHEDVPVNLVEKAPKTNSYIIVMFILSIVHIFAYFGLAVLSEKFIHGIPKAPVNDNSNEHPVKIENLQKEYNKGKVVAVNDLNLTVGRGQIACLLGANGSGKTTTLEMISGIQRPTSGNIILSGDAKLGICPQKNVLWDKLTVREHVEIWAGIKGVDKNKVKEYAAYWIDNCDLAKKEKTKSGHLSGGQKRKLQLAITFIGGSNVCCIDEVSSGLDPLSRRKIWDILLAQDASIILTTHFLDEADLLADKVAIMSKGELKAEGSAVHLKDTMGGYRIFVQSFGTGSEEVMNVGSSKEMLEEIERLEAKGVDYRIAGPELEDVFLQVASADHEGEELNEDIKDFAVENERKEIGMFKQAVAMFRKRLTIFKRNPLAEIATFAVPVIVAAATRSFLVNFEGSSCSPTDQVQDQKFSTVPFDVFKLVAGNDVRENRDGLASFATGFLKYGNYSISDVEGLIMSKTHFVNSFDKFTDYIGDNFRDLIPGGVFMVPPTIAYKINSNTYGTYESSMVLNLLNNLRMNGDVTLVTDFSPFQNPWTNGTGDTLQFIVYFGLAMSVAPAFIGLYPTFERISKVRAMHYSNGLRILPLWSAYTTFNFILGVLMSAILIAIIGTATSHVIGIGYLFLCFMLYCLSSILLAYIVSMFVTSQLAAFAMTAAMQAIYFLLYLIAYMCVQVFGDPGSIASNLLVVHFCMAVLFPVANLIRSLFVSMNLFGVLCKEHGGEITYSGHILAYSGPILYFILQSVVYYLFIIWWDSGKYRFDWRGYLLRRRSRTDSDAEEAKNNPPSEEVIKEMEAVDANPESYNGALVQHVSKSYNGKTRVVDDVTFGIQQNEVFALLGPNGAGKTTTFNMLRGEDAITEGRILVNGVSVSQNRTLARSRLGVCPQFDAMDKLKVVETLKFYARLRGLSNIQEHVDRIIDAVGIGRFKDRLAHKLSGGNKRKLSLAIALIGDPAVLLLDEPSSGMDAFAKRIMWKTLASVAANRATVLTTHSMEEADALCNRAGILSKRLLTVGTTSYLRDAYGSAYHVHIICSTAPDTSKDEMDKIVEWVVRQFPGSTVGDRLYQGQIKMAVPGDGKLSDIFRLFEKYRDELGIESYSVSNTTLEEVFLKIVN